jgi:hypothetical protein
MAGLLACPVFDCLPIRRLPDSGYEVQKLLTDLQLRVQLPIYTGFPFFIIKKIYFEINL